MAIFHLTTKIIARSKGHSAVAAAAYRARTELTNERTGETWNYSRKASDVLFAGIYAPKGSPEWMQDRSQLWNSIEKSERQHNSQVARDFIIALPHELDLKQQRYALQDWVMENFTKRGFVADVAIHKPNEEGDERNTHAHVLVTMRTVAGETFNTRKERSADRLADLDQWRDSWERIGNRHLQRHGHEATLDRRTLEAQGIDRTPQIHLGQGTTAHERNGVQTDRGDILHEIQRENLARDLTRQFQHTVTVHELAQGDPIETRSAIDRQRDEDREEDRRNGFRRDEGTRGVLAAIWSLARTSGNTLAHILGVNRADLMQQRYRIAGAPAREVAPEPQAPAEAPKMPERKPAPATVERPADRLTLIAQKTVIDAARKNEAAERVWEKYNGPENQDVVRDRDAGDTSSRNQPAAWAPARQDLGRVEGLLRGLKEGHMIQTPETPPPPEEKKRPSSRLERIEREAREAGRELRDLLPRPQERTDGRDDPGRVRGPGGR